MRNGDLYEDERARLRSKARQGTVGDVALRTRVLCELSVASTYIPVSRENDQRWRRRYILQGSAETGPRWVRETSILRKLPSRCDRPP